jgi:hypothetical protein
MAIENKKTFLAKKILKSQPKHGTLTEWEGSVQLTSSIKKLVLEKSKKSLQYQKQQV